MIWPLLYEFDRLLSSYGFAITIGGSAPYPRLLLRFLRPWLRERLSTNDALLFALSRNSQELLPIYEHLDTLQHAPQV